MSQISLKKPVYKSKKEKKSKQIIIIQSDDNVSTELKANGKTKIPQLNSKHIQKRLIFKANLDELPKGPKLLQGDEPMNV